MPPFFSPGETYEEAVYRKMVYRGDSGAMFLLGKLIVGGRAMTNDLVEAHKWFNLAMSHGSIQNYRYYGGVRDEVAASLTPEQVIDAQKRAREWLAAFDKPTK